MLEDSFYKRRFLFSSNFICLHFYEGGVNKRISWKFLKKNQISNQSSFHKKLGSRKSKNLTIFGQNMGFWNSVIKSEFLDFMKAITQNVAFEFWHFPPIFGLLKLTCLVTLLDRKLQVFKKSQKWTIFGIFSYLFCMFFQTLWSVWIWQAQFVLQAFFLHNWRDFIDKWQGCQNNLGDLISLKSIHSK